MSQLIFLGEFVFQTTVDNVNGISIATDGRLSKQDVLQRIPPVQSLGPGSRTITISGTILPEHQGGLGQIEGLHGAADDGMVRACATGYGRFLGFFKVSKVHEDDRFLAYAGLPRKIDFKIDLLRAPPPMGGMFGIF